SPFVHARYHAAPGHNDVDPNVVVEVIERQCCAQADHAALAGAVSEEVPSTPSGPGADVHDGSAALLNQNRKHRLRTEEHAFQVDVDGLVPDLLGRVEDR